MTFDSLREFKLRYPERFEFCQAATLGLITWLAMLVFPISEVGFIRHAVDENADRLMRLANHTTDKLDRSVELTFVDIDNPTWQEWQAPAVLPRDKLAELIRAALRSKSRAIIVDVNLAFPDDRDREVTLRKFLAAYPASGPPLILVRDLKVIGPDVSPRLPGVIATSYEDAVAQSRSGGAQVTWATPLFERDSDGIIRRWRLFEPVCDNGQSRVIPSIALVAADIVRRPAPTSQVAPKSLDEQLARLKPRDCTGSSPTPQPITLATADSRRPIVVGGMEPSQRLIYRIPWSPYEPGLGPTIKADGVTTSLVQVRAARSVLAAGAEAILPVLTDRIVIIGGSYQGSGDSHATPLGDMPGAMILANAVHALIYSGTPRQPPFLLNVVLTLTMIALVSLASVMFRPFIAALISAAGILVFMLLLLPVFRSGVVLSFAAPALGAMLHDKVNALIKFIPTIREEGIRCVLRPKAHEAVHDGSPRNSNDSTTGSGNNSIEKPVEESGRQSGNAPLKEMTKP